MQLSPDQLQAYHRDGFVAFPHLLDEAECDTLNQAVEEVLAEIRAEAAAAGRDPAQALPHGVFVGLSLRREIFRQYARDPRLVDPLESIWGPDIGFLSDKVVFKSEEVEFGSPWHQDWAYWQGAHKVSIWVALDEATEENGCLLLLPGTHHRPIDHDKVQDAIGFGNRLDPRAIGIEVEPVAMPLPRGGAVLFHDLALHASLPNRTGAPRRALIVTYRSLAEEDLDYPGLPAACRVRGAEAAAAG